jgi:predicted nucleic acid-binding protein
LILDTSFLIDLLRGRESAKKVNDEIRPGKITPISVMELWEGVQLTDKTSEERKAVQKLLEELKEAEFDTESALEAGRISAELQEKGEIIQPEDIMIAGVALRNDEKLLTREISEFEKIEGIETVSY